MTDVRETQEVIEYIEDVSSEIRETQNLVEYAHPILIPIRESQVVIEVLMDVSVEMRQTQNIIEIIAIPPDSSGIYFINPAKKHDTYYDKELKIPNPTIKTAYIGE